MPRYYDMVDHWEKYGPPVYIAVAAYLGLGKKKPRGNQDSSPIGNSGDAGNLEDLARMLQASGGVLNG